MKYCYFSLYGMFVIVVLLGFIYKVKEIFFLWRIFFSYCLVVLEIEKEDVG